MDLICVSVGSSPHSTIDLAVPEWTQYAQLGSMSKSDEDLEIPTM
ncbi:MAG TPA: hypothetical protein VMW71_00030 [Thermoplasmata archaeon]|nr:hypothetical protein [Thermoplasmata archaeon]